MRAPVAGGHNGNGLTGTTGERVVPVLLNDLDNPAAVRGELLREIACDRVSVPSLTRFIEHGRKVRRDEALTDRREALERRGRLWLVRWDVLGGARGLPLRRVRSSDAQGHCMLPALRRVSSAMFELLGGLSHTMTPASVGTGMLYVVRVSMLIISTSLRPASSP